MITVALDVMGGDNCPDSNIDGARLALLNSKEIFIKLCGPKAMIEEKLAVWKDVPEEARARVGIIDAPEVISLDEAPVAAIQKKKESTIVKGIMAVKTGEADAFVSAGSSGAILAGGQLKLGRIKGAVRTPLAALIPTEKGVSLLLDCGANVDARPEWLCQFARMGSLYMEHVCGIKEPVVKLVNIGLEDEKGNALIKATKPLIESLRGLNYQGYIESREIPHGGADVVVTDAFTGNAMLKLYEGTGSTLIHAVKGALMKDLRTKLGALLIMPALKSTLKRFDASEYGGAPLLGLKGLVVKCHGNAKAKEISTALKQCELFVSAGMGDRVSEALSADKAVMDAMLNAERTAE